MSRKKQKQRRRRRRISNPAKFALGSAVRVKPGILDPDYPDIPLGGWAGTITEIDPRRPVHYLIEWNQATLDAMHPVFRKRCLRDDLDIREYWLGEHDIEADTDASLSVQQPASIVTLPLDPRRRDDRIRAVFGLTRDDPFPSLNEESIGTYHRHLLAHLAFPIPARWYNVDFDSLRAYRAYFSVTGLLDADEGDREEGLLCEAFDEDQKVVVPLAEIEIARSNPNWRLIEDYSHWFQNAPQESWTEPEPVAKRRESQRSNRLGAIVMTAVVFAVYGAIAGSIGSALDGAFLAWKIGAGILGSLGLLVASSRSVAAGTNAQRWLSACHGAICLGLAGGLFGMILVALPAALAGAMAVGLGARLLVRRNPGIRTAVGAALGAILGATAQAWWYSPEDALAGTATGAVIAAAVGLVWAVSEAAVPLGLSLLRRTHPKPTPATTSSVPIRS